MKKRFLSTFITIVFFISLLAYANYFETDEILTQGMQKPEDIINCNESDILSIAWINNNTSDLQATRADNNEFKITQPYELRIDKAEISGLIKTISELKSEMVVATNSTDTKPFGITASSPQTIIKTTKGEYKLTLGDKNPIGGSFYLAKDGDKRVFMVPSYVRGIFQQDLKNLRSKNIFYEDFSDIDSLTLVESGKPIVIAKDKSMNWQMLKPRQLSVDAQEVSSIIFGIRDIKIDEFVDDNPGKEHPYGFDDPHFRVIMKNTQGQTYELVVGNQNGANYYIKRNSEKFIYSINMKNIEKYRKTIDELREKALPKFDISSANKLTLKNASHTFTLVKKSDKWMNGKLVVDSNIITKLLNSYSKAKVSRFVPDSYTQNGFVNIPQNNYLEIMNANESLKVVFGKQKGLEVAVLIEDEIMLTESLLIETFDSAILKLIPNKYDKKIIVDN